MNQEHEALVSGNIGSDLWKADCYDQIARLKAENKDLRVEIEELKDRFKHECEMITGAANDENDTLRGANESLRNELARHVEIIDELREQLAVKEIKNDDKV